MNDCRHMHVPSSLKFGILSTSLPSCRRRVPSMPHLQHMCMLLAPVPSASAMTEQKVHTFGNCCTEACS